MAKRQTRRTISISGKAYWRLHNLCRRTGKSISGVMEFLAKGLCDEAGEPEVDALPEKAKPGPPDHGHYFTF